jgi:hypothetical protein
MAERNEESVLLLDKRIVEERIRIYRMRQTPVAGGEGELAEAQARLGELVERRRLLKRRAPADRKRRG